MRFSSRWILPLALSSAACGRSADVIGGKPEKPPPEPQDTGWSTDFEACATESAQASPVATSLFLAVDTSCSMADPADGSTTGTTPSTVTKWDAATSAFTAFFEDPASATIDVALRLWPSTADGCNDTDCDPVACSQPQVPLDSMSDPAHKQALIDAFVNTVPDGGTPMHPALEGATQWAAAQRLAAPDEEVAIVLVTDGEPNGCDEDISHIADLATTSSAAGVPVYAVGIAGSNVAQIDQIAQAGGTSGGYFVGSVDAEADLVAALKDIQSHVLSCQYAFPTESSGDPLSPDLVRLEYTLDGEDVLSGRVSDAAACGPDGGWYLDDPDHPTTITLCPSTCSALQGITTVQITIDVGCTCVSDSDCPGDDVCGDQGCVAPCVGADCPSIDTDDGTITGPLAVQGGAWRCDTIPGPAGAALALFGLAVLLARRVQS
jgi:hypothetical protein